jgi:serine/threonine-protein kinase HipA
MRDTPTQQILDVYLQSQLAGKLTSTNAQLSFAYDPGYLQHPNARKLSTSMPLQSGVFGHSIAATFFSGLLPDEGVRARLAQYLSISERNTFALLKAIGGECAGAISLYPEGITPQSQQAPSYRTLSEVETDEVLASLDKRPLLAGEEDVRISGAGAQNKLMIAFTAEGKIAIPTGSTASTHIIKPPIQGLDDSVFNEFFCMQLSSAIGLPTPETSILWIKGKPYYLVARYDRHKNDFGIVHRLHQEDFCQAMHIAPEMKYENEGGPTLEQCFALLSTRIASGAMAGKNKITLLQGVIFNFLIGNGDAHGKNFSILYQGEAESLAPFYDLLCTLIYTDAYKAKMAMKIGGKYKFKEVSIRHWGELGHALGLRPDFVRRQIMIINNDVAKSAASLFGKLNSNPETASPVYEKIMAIIAANHKKMTNFQNDE